MSMTILKFGGSSVGNSERINSVIDILTKYYLNNGKKIAVVFSAFQGVTDKLIEIARKADRRDDSYKEEFDSLVELHLKVAADLNRTEDLPGIEKLLLNLFGELKEILHGAYLVSEVSPKTLDFIQSFGEKLSCTIISYTMQKRGIDCEYLDASKLIKTDDNYGNAKVNEKISYNKIKRYFSRRKRMQIITGFIASTGDNEITTLGRGGSDYTASIFGAALNAKKIEIWTDVDGILTADPRKVKGAFPLSTVTYEEAMELSHFGAKVIYPPTILPALKKNIEIVIKNTFNPEFPGTRIIKREQSSDMTVKGISSIDNVTLLGISGGGMVGVTGIAGRLFTALARYNVNIILISQASSEHSICIAVPPSMGKTSIKAIEEEFKLEIMEGKISRLSLEENLSIIAVVGENMRHTPGIAGKVFQALGKNNINIIAIAQGSSELNISLIVDRKDISKALNVLHKSLLKTIKR